MRDPRPETRRAGTALMRVAYLADHAGFFGGGEASLRDLAVGIARRGFEPIVLLPGAGPLASACETAGVAWRRFPIPSLLSPAAAAAAVVRLARLIHAERIDLLHTAAPRPALLAGLAGRLTGTPHLFHVRSCRPDRWIGDRLLVALSDRVLAVSEAAARRSGVLARAARLRVVPTGLPPPALLEPGAARVVLGIPPDRFVCGVVGRIEIDKGADVAIGAWPAVLAGRPDALLVFLGPAGAVRRRRRDKAWRSAVGTVLFLGEHPAAARYLGAFDCLLHPARHDALPRVLIEAAFAGVPVVATDVGGIPEILPDGSCAVLVPPGDPGLLARAVLALAADEGRRRRLADNARTRAHARFTLPRMLDAVETEYLALAAPEDAVARSVEARPR